MTVQRHNPAYRLASFLQNEAKCIALQRKEGVAFSNRCWRTNFANKIRLKNSQISNL